MATPISPTPEGQTTEAETLPNVPWERVDRFVGQLTHDIRNGLNAIELQLTFLGEISTDPEAVEEVKRVRATLGNVTRQLQTLRVATGAIRLYLLEYPASEFFDDLRERLVKSHPGSEDRVAWETNFGPDSMLAVDPELTLSALLELLGNALVFSDVAGSPIHVEVSTAGDRAIVTLHEPQPRRPDIAPQDWGRTPLLTTRRGAYGLGLFRARRSFEAQGGRLEVVYSAENQRLTTTVMLPITPQKQS